MQKEGGSNSAGTASVVLGILSIPLAVGYAVGYAGPVLAILGIIFSVLQNKHHKTNAAKIGMILSIIGLVLFVAVLFVALTWLRTLRG